ncbi:MAG: hypothetical protein ACRBBP_10175 [Bdellovibrionales bacterium]
MKNIILALAALLLQSEASVSHAETRSFSRIGSSFNREFLNDTNSLSEPLTKPAMAVAQFGTSSAFYIHSEDGKHYFGTAAHSAYAPIFRDGLDLGDLSANSDLCKVFPNALNSDSRIFRLGLANIDFKCKKLLLILPHIDFAIFEAVPLDNKNVPVQGVSLNAAPALNATPLSLLSYSSYLNPGLNRKLSLAYSSGHLCQVISKEPLIKYIHNSLHQNSQSIFRTPYIATGCDAAAGDSGAPLLNNITGALAGVLSAIPVKQTYSMTSDDALLLKLDGLLGIIRNSLIWNDLTYVVPIQSIQEELLNVIETTTDEDLKHTLQNFFK